MASRLRRRGGDEDPLLAWNLKYRADSGSSRSALSLRPEPLEAVRELRTSVTLVREPGDEERERLRVTGDPQGPSVHRIEAHVSNQLSRHGFGALVVAAVYQTRSAGLALGCEHAKQHFARHSTEGGDDPSLGNLLCELLRARGGVCDHESGIVSVHW